MIALSIVLIVIGAILLVLAATVPNAAPLNPIGWVLVAVGLVLLVVFAVVVGADEADRNIGWIGGGLAMATIPPTHGHFHGMHDDDPSTPVAGGLADRQPVLVGFIVGAVPLVLAAVSALADLFTGVPDWVVPAFTVLGTLTTGLAAMWARQQVTPTALPQLDEGVPLVPMVENEAT